MDVKDNVKFTRIASATAGLFAAVGWGYLGLSEIWKLPFGSEVWASANVIVGTISLALGAITFRKGFREDGSYGDITVDSLRESEEGSAGMPPAHANRVGDGPGRADLPPSSFYLGE